MNVTQPHTATPYESGKKLHRFRIVRCVGRGSMGFVYLCEDSKSPGTKVALKVFRLDENQDPDLRERFLNEFEAARRVKHPNVIKPIEFVEDASILAYSMEHVGGGDLGVWIQSRTAVQTKRIIDFLSALCAAVQAIHNAGVIHRDLKPSNILLTEEDQIRVIDFATAHTAERKRVTAKGAVVGTIEYLSPEYLDQGEISPLGDIYALGTIAYEMCTGLTPFRGKPVVDLIQSKLSSLPPAPHVVNSACPRALSALIMRAIQIRPGDRYQNAIEMAEDLEFLATMPNLPEQFKVINKSLPNAETVLISVNPGKEKNAEVKSVEPDTLTPAHKTPVPAPKIPSPPLSSAKSQKKNLTKQKRQARLGIRVVLAAALGSFCAVIIAGLYVRLTMHQPAPSERSTAPLTPIEKLEDTISAVQPKRIEPITEEVALPEKDLPKTEPAIKVTPAPTESVAAQVQPTVHNTPALTSEPAPADLAPVEKTAQGPKAGSGKDKKKESERAQKAAAKPVATPIPLEVPKLILTPRSAVPASKER